MKQPKSPPVLLVGLLFFCSLIAARGYAAAWAEPAGQDMRGSHFAETVRPDFFAGMRGDEVRFERAMRRCESTLAQDPHNPEALVWHGSGLLIISDRLRAQGKNRESEMQFQKGLQEMDEAASSAPNNPHVLLPRGATLLSVSAAMPPSGMARNLLQKGVQDYETVLSLQAAYFDRLPLHARGELLTGLADGWERLGNHTRARQYRERIVRECAGSPYALESAAWLRKAAATSGHTCQGCHM
jgi:hypothetical protein